VLDGVSQSQDTTLRLCLITDVGVLLSHTNHDTASLLARMGLALPGEIVIPMVTGTTDNGGCMLSDGVS
jgi:hypothetical protein